MCDLEAAWAALEASAAGSASERTADLFAKEPDRLARLTVEAAGLSLDLSKQTWTLAGLDTALALAEAADVQGLRDRLFAGGEVNPSERRAVLHPALRAARGAAFHALGEPVSADVDAVRARMQALAEAVRSGAAKGATGKPFSAVLHIGIGGSDLGPRLVWEALKSLDAPIALRFAANVDPSEIATATHGLDPERTLVVVVSKTFTTQETLANAQAARAWLAAAVGEAGVRAHLAAVSAATDKAADFGVDEARVFGFRDWVGGRYSVWSSVGLSCAVALGWDAWQGFLDGAAAMDAHFQGAVLGENAPVLLALAQIFNRNGLDRRARAVVPYAQRLRLLPAFLQQLEMESNGKGVGKDGQPVKRATAPVVFGDAGTNGQHAFFQMLHQGTDVVPLEFIAVAQASEGPPRQQAMLLSNVIAQAEALMIGRSEADVREELSGKGMDEAEIAVLAPQRTFPGNRPSTLIVMERLTPETLGALLALYEHKTVVEGAIWGINSFDQWGVELGKTLAARILPELESGAANPHDPSTHAAIQRLGR